MILILTLTLAGTFLLTFSVDELPGVYKSVLSMEVNRFSMASRRSEKTSRRELAFFISSRIISCILSLEAGLPLNAAVLLELPPLPLNKTRLTPLARLSKLPLGVFGLLVLRLERLTSGLYGNSSLSYPSSPDNP